MKDEYISRQAAIDEILGQPPDAHYPDWYASQVKAIPAVDVVPVRYGQWMSVPEMWGIFSSRYYCSKCGNDAIINSHERYVLSDFCPHCGARMIYGERRE